MNIYFAENIKALRKSKDMTQENVAQYLGVSFQTVSKWERGESYPDITMLPVIASLFGVTTDELLGVNKAKQEQKIQQYLQNYEAMRLKDTPAIFAEFEKAKQEFPADYRILVRYMELLMAEKTSRDLPKYEKASSELLSIYENIQSHCTDDSIRMWSKRLICQHLHTKAYYTDDDKYQQKAEEILGEMPALIDTREYLSTMLITDIKKHNEACIKCMENLLYLLQNTIINYCYYQDEFSPQYKIDITNSILNAFHTVFPDDDFGKNWMHIVYDYGHLGHWYFELGDVDNAYKYLELCAQYAKKCDAIKNNSLTVAKYYETEKVFHDMKACKRAKELMSKHYPLSDEFRQSERFVKIIKSLS